MKKFIAIVFLLLAPQACATDSLTGARAFAFERTAMKKFIANTLTADQIEVVRAVEYARVAGSGHRCPRFRFIEDAASKELLGARLTPAARDAPEYENAIVAILGIAEHLNRSEFCVKAWQMLGPDGSYRRQMLEAK